MKKIALEAWEKNKDKIRNFIMDFYTDINPLNCISLFLSEIFYIAYRENDNKILAKIIEGNIVTDVMLFKIFTEGVEQPAIICTKYSNLNSRNDPDISIDEKCYIAQQIVLSATPINIANCPREWAEEINGRKWVGIVRVGGIII